MVIVVGLKSGREFIVRDKFYIFKNHETGLLTHAFSSVDEKRLITVPPEGSIEFIDEPSSPEILKTLEENLNSPEIILNKVEDDPNVA